MQITNRIQEVLNAKGLRLVYLSAALGVAKSSVCQWCSNAVQPLLPKLNKIADDIGFDITDLIVSKKKKK